MKKAGFTVSYRKIDWADYESQINVLFDNREFDVTFATSVTQGDFLGNAGRGA